jgi:hypothetical protein
VCCACDSGEQCAESVLAAGQCALLVVVQAFEGVVLCVEVCAKGVEQVKAGGLEAMRVVVMGCCLDFTGEGQELLMAQQRCIGMPARGRTMA